MKNAATYQAIYEAADEGGTIQAADMARLFPGQPERHTTTSLANALRQAGATEEQMALLAEGYQPSEWSK